MRKNLSFRIIGIAVLFFCLVLVKHSVFADSRAAINLAGFWTGQFQDAVDAIGEGGNVNIMACPSDIPLLNQVLQEANYPRINLWIRGHWTSALTPEFAEDWGLALRALDTRYKVYFFPANEPNGAFENELNASPGTEGAPSINSIKLSPAVIKAYTDALFAATEGIRGSKVEIVSPTIDPFASYDQNHAYINALGSSYFDQFYGVSLSLYGQYEQGGLIANPAAKNGDFINEPAFRDIMHAGTKPTFVETGVLCNQFGSTGNATSVVYGQDLCFGQIADHVISEYFALRANSPWGSNVFGPSILSYNPDPKNFQGGDITDDNSGWILDSGSETLQTMKTAFPSGGITVPQSYSGGSDTAALEELQAKIASGGLQTCAVDERPEKVSSGDQNVMVILNRQARATIKAAELLGIDISQQLSNFILTPEGSGNIFTMKPEMETLEAALPGTLPYKFQVVDKREQADPGKTALRLNKGGLVSMKATLYTGQQILDKATDQKIPEKVDGNDIIRPALDNKWSHRFRSLSRAFCALTAKGCELSANSPNEINLVEKPVELTPDGTPNQSNNGETVVTDLTYAQGSIEFQYSVPLGVQILAQVLIAINQVPEDTPEGLVYNGNVEIARLASQNAISGFTQTGDKDPKDEAQKFYDAGIPFALKSDYSENGTFDNKYSGLDGAETITLVSNEAKSMKDANTMRFCATLPLGSAEHRSLCGSGGSSGTDNSSGGTWPTNGINIKAQCTLDSNAISNIINTYHDPNNENNDWIGAIGASHLRDLAGIINNVAQEKGVNALLLATLWGEETYFSARTGYGLGCKIGAPALSEISNTGLVAAHVEEQARCIANTMNTTVEESGKTDPLGQFQAFICRWARGPFSCTYNSGLADIVEGSTRTPNQRDNRPGVLDFYNASGNSCGTI